MAHRLQHSYTLTALAVLSIFSFSAKARAQEISSKLEEEVLKAFAESTEEMEVDGVKIRGHVIGNGKFKSCEGRVMDINNRPLSKADRCRQSGGPRNVVKLVGEVVGVDKEKSVIELKRDDTGEVVKLFIPPSIKLITDGRIDPRRTMSLEGMSIRTQKIAIFSVEPGRAEAVAEH